jgi:hypothetical protein
VKSVFADESMEDEGWKMNEVLQVGRVQAGLLYKSVRFEARCNGYAP